MKNKPVWLSKWKKLGPGLVTGASDDDPSGILTYLQTGVVLGFSALWMTLLTLPFMYVLEEMSGRLGTVSKQGIVKLIRKRFSGWVFYPLIFLVLLVIIINIGADLLAIGVVMEILTGINREWWLFAAALVTYLSLSVLNYEKIARVLKWLTLSLLFYVLVVFFLNINWLEAIISTFSPSISWSGQYIFLMAAVLGTTISPYLFMWQADEEMEERLSIHKRHQVFSLKQSLSLSRRDVFVGMLLSNVVMWFIIAAASQLNILYGLGEIQTFEDASLILKPLLGPLAFLVFSLGLIGTGLLALPVLASCFGYALAELFDWHEGISRTFRDAVGFYIAIGGAVFSGMLIMFLDLNIVDLLILTAALYTIATPPFIYLILKLANDKKLLGEMTNSKISNIVGGAAFVVMSFSAIALIVLWFWPSLRL